MEILSLILSLLNFGFLEYQKPTVYQYVQQYKNQEQCQMVKEHFGENCVCTEGGKLFIPTRG